MDSIWFSVVELETQTVLLTLSLAAYRRIPISVGFLSQTLASIEINKACKINFDETWKGPSTVFSRKICNEDHVTKR